MTINLTPDIQSQIYMDKKDSYLVSMVEQLSPKIEYEPKQKEQTQQTDSSNNEKKESFFKESEFTYNSYLSQKSLNSNIGSTQGFLDTLSAAGGNVKEAS